MDDREPHGDVRGLASLQWAYKAALHGRIVGGSLLVVLVLATVLSMVGRIGDASEPLLHRLFFWTSCALLCWPLCHAIGAVVLYLMRLRPPFAIALAAVGGTLFLTLPCTAVVYTFYGLFHPGDAASVGIFEVYANVLIVASMASAIVHYVVCQQVELRYAVLSAEAGAEEPFPGRPAGAAPRASGDQGSAWFFDRIPEALGRDVICITVSGHYLDVVTTVGSCLVLLPLGDAVAALGDLGMQVHRSHWVAHRHVLALVRQGQHMRLQVTGAREIPVSRSHVAEVRAAVGVNGS